MVLCYWKHILIESSLNISEKVYCNTNVSIKNLNLNAHHKIYLSIVSCLFSIMSYLYCAHIGRIRTRKK